MNIDLITGIITLFQHYVFARIQFQLNSHVLIAYFNR
jgi:hypothetical protein